MLLVLDLGHALDPRHEKRVAVEKIEDAKAPLALADHMMLAVGARHIAQDVGLGAHAVQIDGDRVLGRRIALQHQPDRPVEPDRRLRRRDRALAAERDRQHRSGKQHQIARRDQDQRVGGERRNPGQRCFDRAGRRGAAGSAVRSSCSSRGIAEVLGKESTADAARRSQLVQLHHQAAIGEVPAGNLEPARAAARSAAGNARAGSPADEFWPCATSGGSGRSPLTISTPALASP